MYVEASFMVLVCAYSSSFLPSTNSHRLQLLWQVEHPEVAHWLAVGKAVLHQTGMHSMQTSYDEIHVYQIRLIQCETIYHKIFRPVTS